MPRQWQWQYAGYFQLLSRAESTWYDTIVKLLLQSAAVVCFVPLLVSLVLLCSLVAALLEFATRSIAFFKLALMGFHLSWMPYTFKICVYPVYSWARGVYTLGTSSAGAATWSFNWWASVYFGAIQFQLSFRCITCLQIAGTVSRSVPFPSLDLHLYFYSHSPNLVQERFNVISVLFLLFYFPCKVKVKTKLQRNLQRTTTKRNAASSWNELKRRSA